jgi:Domain of unknown function (DU1801)
MERMAKARTRERDASVDKFVNAVPAEITRRDCATLIQMMSAATGCEARMWGSSIIGFDRYHYRLANGKPGEICLIGFSPRKQNLVLYVTDDHERDADLLAKLGKIGTGKSCIYVKTLSDLHAPTLKELIRRAVKERKKTSAAGN